MKQKIKGKNCAVFCFAGKRFFLFIYEVIMSETPVRRKYSRHIDIRRYFARDLVAQNVLKLIPLRTSLMVADALSSE
jgi:hypothetical protein